MDSYFVPVSREEYRELLSRLFVELEGILVMSCNLPPEIVYADGANPFSYQISRKAGLHGYIIFCNGEKIDELYSNRWERAVDAQVAAATRIRQLDTQRREEISEGNVSPYAKRYPTPTEDSSREGE